MNLRPIKACHACRRSFTLPQWNALPYRTEETENLRGKEGVAMSVEVRACFCGELLTLDPALAGIAVDALPLDHEPCDCGREHTSSRAEPPPEALADDPHYCPRSWGYRTEAATVFFAHVPLVPYPRPIERKRAGMSPRSMLELLLQARALMDLFVANLTAQMPEDGGGNPPTDEPEPEK